MADDELSRLYGSWAARTPDVVRALFEGYPGVWWIAGGWAIEAFTGVRRPHGDIDPGILRADLPLLRTHLAGRLDLWAAFSGALKPVSSDDPAELPIGCGQLWCRAGGDQPWEYDILLGPGTTDEWRYRREPSIRMPMADALWMRDGIRYLRPEIQLLYKSKGLRPKDEDDFATTLPHLDRRRRGWLADALRVTHPEHSWIQRLR